MSFLSLTALSSSLRSLLKLFNRVQLNPSIKAITLVKLYLPCQQLCFQYLFQMCNLEVYLRKRLSLKVAFWPWLTKGDRWLADKGFIVQHILDDFGVRIETPVKLEGKKQFTEEKDVHNRKTSQVRVHVERGIRRI